MSASILTADRLRKLLDYDHASGIFIWRVNRGRVMAGIVAGYYDKEGYISIKIDGIQYKAHRLAWFYETGEWPTMNLDHRDGNRSSNQLDNLRLATQHQNMQNKRKAHINSRSGILGVSWDKNNKRWEASIYVAGKTRHIGRFSTSKEASDAYITAKREYHEFCTI